MAVQTLMACGWLLGAAPHTSAQVVLPEPLPSGEERDVEAARAAYAEVEARYAKGDLQGALTWAGRTLAAYPMASVAVIRATLLSELKRPREAFAAWLQALTLEPNEAQREQILAGLATAGREASPALGWLLVDVSPQTAVVAIDGDDIPTGVALGLPVGRHLMSASSPGLVDQIAAFEITAGEARHLEVSLKAVAQALPEPQLQAPPPRGPETSSASSAGADLALAGWITAGGGLAIALAGVGMNVWGIDTARAADAYSQPKSGLSSEDRLALYGSLSDSADTRLYAAYALYGAAGLAVATGVVLVVLDGTGDEPSPPVSVSPWVGHGRGGLAVLGAF